jgi:hypothetical protein
LAGRCLFCDGRNVESWFGGTDDGADITVKSKSAALQAGWPVSSTRVKTTIGWIVLEDGSQVGVQTTGTGLAAMLQLDPENPQVTVEGESLGAKLVSGDEDL